jgi:lipoyl(octanoyl) transferase
LVRTALNQEFYLDRPVEWVLSAGPVPYPAACDFMERRVAEIRAGTGAEMVWLLEHPPLYTAGTSAKAADLLDPRFPVFASPRGGQYTYHGPGQRIAYVMLNLADRRRDVRAFVASLEEWIFRSLDAFNIKGERRDDRVGVWVDRTLPGEQRREDKIAAIGVRLRHWVSFHGIALNVEPDLSHFGGIVPCGVTTPGFGVTSLVDLGIPATMDDADAALRTAFESVFGPTKTIIAPEDAVLAASA